MTDLETVKATPSLQGCRIALTVARDDPYSPARELTDLEAALIYYPVVQILPPDSYDELDSILRHFHSGKIDWLLLTTPCAVEALSQRLKVLEIDPSTFAKGKVAFYGALTRIAARALLPTWRSAIPNAGSHQEVVDALQLSSGHSVAIPIAQRSRSDWRHLATGVGASVHTAPAYRLLLGRGGDDLPGALWGGVVDAILFLTENSVRHFAIRLKAEGGSLDMLRDVVVGCLDEQTARAALGYGLHASITPTDQTLSSLAKEMAELFSAQAE
jgi:uroporphyrinogen-III synthase